MNILKNLSIKLNTYFRQFSKFFISIVITIVGIFISLIVFVLFVSIIFEYFLIEEFTLYAMKKTKLFLGTDLLHFNKGGLPEVVIKRLVNFSKSINNTTSLVHNTNLLSSHINSSWISSSKELLEYKAQFSTYVNSKNFINNGSTDITIDQLKNVVYYFESGIVKTHLWKFLPPEIYNFMCGSFGEGFFRHGWFVVKDSLTDKFFIGICTHDDGVISVCKTFKCGRASFTHEIMAGIDFAGKPETQYMRNFVVFENKDFNNMLLEYIKLNSVENVDNIYLNYEKILQVLNSNEFTYVSNTGKFYFNSKDKGLLELKCCLKLDTLSNLK